jgi:hypothetical protein
MALGVAVAAGFATPAYAASKYVGSGTAESRCVNGSWVLCLYWGGFSTAYFGTNASKSNLAGYTFFQNTGSGSGQSVKNNAAGITCDYDATAWCRSYYNEGYTGNYDWLYAGERGALFYTWNDEASVYIA